MRGTSYFELSLFVLFCLFSFVSLKTVKRLTDTEVIVEQRIHKRQATLCGKEFDVGDNVIDLPQVNNRYLSNLYCRWVIQTPPGTTVLLTSNYFAVENSVQCKFDYLEIRDGFDDVNSTVSRFCGSEPLALFSLTNQVYVYFVSDGFYEEQGVSIYFKTVTNDTQSRCNSTITEDTVMTSPGYPLNYPINTDCFYWIRGHKGQVIEFEVTDLNIVDDSCLFDYIEVFDGLSTHSEKISTICGTEAPQTISSTAENMFLHFHSDYFQENRGFHATITIISQTQDETSQSSARNSKGCIAIVDDKMTGIITSPNYPLIYPNNKKCVTIIRAPLPDHFIRLNVTFMDIEGDENCTFDFLEIYDNEDEVRESTSGRLCGTLNSEKIYESKDTNMKLVFTSDNMIGLSGFTAQFDVIPRDVCFPRCKENQICVRHSDVFECVTGSLCVNNVCENGKCIETTTGTNCYCPPGFDGMFCQNIINEEHDGRPVLKFTKVPNDEHIQRGRRVLLECRVNDRMAEYTWLYEDLMIQSDSGRVQVLPGGVLDIRSFDENFEGVYKCLASTQNDFAEFTFRLTMVEDCNLDVEVPPRNIVSVEGSTALFSCYIPAATEIQWFKDDIILLPSITDRLSVLGYGYYLTIDSVTLSDAGQYKCKARSEYGCYVERSASLSVTEKEEEQGVCGRTQGNKDLTETLTSRISGGKTVDYGSTPWHVIIRAKKQKKTFCGGSLISEDWVVTAAHCISHYQKEFHEPFVKENIELYLGTDFCDGKNGTKRKIQRFIIHQNFSQRAPYDNDIALIKLDSPINYTDMIKPICTKPFGLVNDMFFARRVGRKVGRVIGCGRKYENIEEVPTKLHDVYVPNVDRDLCDRADIGHRNFTDSMYCAGYDRAYFGDACYGDSGGSLTMQMSRNDPWILVGLVSWGVGCDRSGHYGYYTNVAMFVDWINHQTSFWISP